MSKAELAFRNKYPFANVRPGHHFPLVEVYAGDYPCAEGRTVASAFAEALRYDEAGLITPDPNELPRSWMRPLELSANSMVAGH